MRSPQLGTDVVVVEARSSRRGGVWLCTRCSRMSSCFLMFQNIWKSSMTGGHSSYNLYNSLIELITRVLLKLTCISLERRSYLIPIGQDNKSSLSETETVFQHTCADRDFESFTFASFPMSFRFIQPSTNPHQRHHCLILPTSKCDQCRKPIDHLSKVLS